MEGGWGGGHIDRVKLKLFPVTILFHSCQVLSKIWLSPMGGGWLVVGMKICPIWPKLAGGVTQYVHNTC